MPNEPNLPADTIDRPVFGDDNLFQGKYPLQEIVEGAHSKAFLFETPDGARVLRLNNETDYGFKKDDYAATHFATDTLPIPKITELGQQEDGTYYAVSEARPGITLGQAVREHAVDEKLALKMISLIGAIGKTKVQGEGFGWWDDTGTGQQASWHETMAGLRDLPDNPDLHELTLFDAEFHQRVKDVINALLPFCPESRKLAHGDLSGNVLIDGVEITGVIDWSHSMYGDFLYDVGQLEFTYPELNIKSLVEKNPHLISEDGSSQLPEHFQERILCYMLLRGTSDICYFASEGKPTRAKNAKQRIADLIEQKAPAFS